MILEPLALAVVLAILVRGAVRIYAIPSGSMAPTLEIGDQIVVTPYFRTSPSRGDVVVFRSPSESGEWIVKRVVAVPGDWIDTRLGRVRVGGHTLAEPYLSRQAESGSIPFQILPADGYFVLGDNRGDSVDSRSWGVIPRHLIAGRARLVLWSARHPISGTAHAESEGDPHGTAKPRQARLFKWVR